MPSPWDFGGWCFQVFSTRVCSVVEAACTMVRRMRSMETSKEPLIQFTNVSSTCTIPRIHV
jgi:hypothetical protein